MQRYLRIRLRIDNPVLNPASSPIPIPDTDYCGEIGGFMSRKSPQSYSPFKQGPPMLVSSKRPGFTANRFRGRVWTEVGEAFKT